MRRSFPVLALCAALTPALAQQAPTTSSFDSARDPDVTVVSVLSFLPLGPLLLVIVAFAGLFKLCTRWPQYEPWLVAASLLALPPFATFVMRWIVHLTVSTGRDTGIFWTAIALLLGAAWWLVKTRTTLLAASGALPPSTRGSRAEAVRAEPPPARAPVPAPAPAPAAPPEPARAARSGDAIFISYRRQDSADATGRIYDRLVQRFGREQVFKDVDSIPLGVDFREHLGNVVGRCTTLLAVIGPQWSTVSGANGRRLDDKGDFVRVEIEAALARNIPVIPVLIGGAELPADTELPPSLAAITYRNGISVRPDPDFHRDMDRLIAGLEQHGRL